ncbi:MBL fold metallo-hydrolase [Hyphobacterium sp. SN044]|uniref:MBL fold metallo-hydrolase n=1 Tax=Hyphobacterium sp. SN044 TaxID=2912575 RepID=UPI001F3C5385|nr:MBL fold metallo-hydrolase [Hyphobacterium sp. SN044]
MILRATILGCGSSGGVPRADGDWGACDPGNSKNARRRCSLLVEAAASDEALTAGETTNILIDTSPDLRAQALSVGLQRIDAVMITHDHADQTHGIDDLRAFVYRARRHMPVHMSRDTAKELLERFDYAFLGDGKLYRPLFTPHVWDAFGEPIRVEGPGGAVDIIPFELEHGPIMSTGFRFGPIAYSPDVNGVPAAAYRILDGTRVWIVDALREEQHPTHASVSDALGWIDRARIPEAVLTNLHIDLDYEALCMRLPQGVRPAYDGLSVTWNGLETRYSTHPYVS